MSSRLDTWSAALVAALESHAVAIAQRAPGLWSFAPAGVPELRATAALAEDWLLFDAPLPEAANGLPAWDAFAINAALPGALKLCAAAGGLRLRAELPLHDHSSPSAAVQDVCAALRAAAEGFGGGVPGPMRDGEDAAFDLARLLAEAGWAFTPRGGDAAMVELDVPGVFQQATVEARPGCGVRVSVPVLVAPPGAAVCGRAAGTFLLRVTGAVRMVRVACGAEPVPVHFEALCAAAPFAAAELAHALAALSLAWRWAGREAAVLAADERVAESFVRAGADDGLSDADFSTTACGQCP